MANRRQRRANASAQAKHDRKEPPKNAFGLDPANPLLQEPSVQRFLWALQGLADGTKKLVIDSRASIRQVEKQIKTYAGAYSGKDKFVTDYMHTFRLEDTNATITEGPTSPIPEGVHLRPGLDTLVRSVQASAEESQNGSSQEEDGFEEAYNNSADGIRSSGGSESEQETPE